MKSVLSASPISSTASSSFPTCSSVWAMKPANTSISLAATGLYLSGYSSQEGTSGGRGVRTVPAGMTPSSSCRRWICARSSSQPPSNWPLNLSMYSGHTWCGQCIAPVAR